MSRLPEKRDCSLETVSSSVSHHFLSANAWLTSGGEESSVQRRRGANNGVAKYTDVGGGKRERENDGVGEKSLRRKARTEV